MGYVRFLRRLYLNGLLRGLTITVALASAAAAQTAQQPPFSPEDYKKYAPVLNELGQFFQKFHANVQYPAPRTQSRLLPLLPESTIVYAGFPNYGEVSHQALEIFRQEVKENPKLHDWWQQGEMATEGPKIEDGVEKIYQLSQYLGDEIVVAAMSADKEDPKFVILAEARKPGLKEFLPRMLKDVGGKSTPTVRVLDAAELANAKDTLEPNKPVILVRPDFIVLGENLATLRRFNAHLEQNAQGFVSTEFRRRLAQGYEGGATIVAGLDLQTILKKEGPKDEKGRATLEHTGFSDMKYLVWDQKSVMGQEISQVELSFTGTRRAVASWLAAPGPMGSLDFVSPKALIAASMLLKDPAQIFDDIADMATASNPNALASLAQMEQGLHLSLRNDLLGRLGGEITLELDAISPQDPVWKVLLKAKDPRGLLSTIRTFLADSKMTPTVFDEDGVTYYTLHIPNQQKTLEISYAVVDRYLVVASGRAGVAQAVRLHRSGQSLAKSGKLESSLPPSQSGSEVSAMLYEDPRAMSALTLRNLAPEMADSLSKSTTETRPTVVALYGDESTLREASRSGSVNFTGALIGAAIAIPNLLRARMAANESSAVATVRTANTAQITYSVTYPRNGYAPDFASLGSKSSADAVPSPRHAGFIESTLGNPTCTAGNWCSKSGYRFTITTSCKLQTCHDYVVTATPESANTGMRNFCSSSDAVIHFQLGSPLNSPVTAAECRNWALLH